MTLTAFFWLPAFVELRYTQLGRPDSPFGDWPRFEQRFVPLPALVEWPAKPADPNLLNPPISTTLGLAQAVLAIIGSSVLIADGRAFRRRWPLLILGLVTLVALFLATASSAWWWRFLPLPQFVQLPTRFLGPASLGVAILSGATVDWFVACVHFSRGSFARPKALSGRQARPDSRLLVGPVQP